MMKQLRILWASALLLTLFLGGCDVIDKPYQQTSSGGGGGNTVKRKVLLEDFTGHKCGNCPRAHEIAKTLSDTYGDRLVVMGVHLSSFAKLDLGHGYTADYRTATGLEIDQTFGPFDGVGLPNGFINRKAFDGISPIVGKDDWSTKIASIINTDPDAQLTITNEYNSSTRNVNIKVDGKFLNTLTGDYKLAVYITQDSIISEQKDYSKVPEDLPNYVHRHVLRGAVNSTWGDLVSTGGSAAANATFSKTFNYTLDPSWDANHCHVVAFINKAGTSVTDKEVIQVEEKKIK